MKAGRRAAAVGFVGIVAAAGLDVTGVGDGPRDRWWARHQRTDQVSSELVIVSQHPDFVPIDYEPTVVLSLLEAISAQRPRAIFVLDPSVTRADMDAGLQVLRFQESSPYTPAVVALRRIDGGTSVPVAEVIGSSEASSAGVAFQTPPDRGDRRLAPLLVEDPASGQLVPSVGLLAFLMAGDRTRSVSLDDGEAVVGGRTVPIEAGSRLRPTVARALNDPDHPSRIEVPEVLTRAIPADTFTGKIVLVGPVSEVGATQLDDPSGGGHVPSILFEANVANTLLTGSFREPVGASVRWTITLAGIGLVALALRLARWAVPVAWMGATAGAVAVAEAMGGHDLLLDAPVVLGGTAATALGAGVAMVGAHLAERRRVRQLFSQYVPAAVVNDLFDSGRAAAAAAGERLLVTVLFCDLRGFTPLSVTMSPTDLRLLLDEYYELLSNAVLERGGTVLQYVGDEIFAVFGAPVASSTHAADALACAVACQDLRPVLDRRLSEHSLPPISYGIGVHTGEVIAAHVGSSLRRQYSVVGEAVNLGSRLCGLAASGEIVYSAATRGAAGAVDGAVSEHEVAVKGLDDRQSIWRCGATDFARRADAQL